MESREAASEMACPMVLQAVVGDLQSLALFPLIPFTCHVLAGEVGATARNSAIPSRPVCMRFITFLLATNAASMTYLDCLAHVCRGSSRDEHRAVVEQRRHVERATSA